VKRIESLDDFEGSIESDEEDDHGFVIESFGSVAGVAGVVCGGFGDHGRVLLLRGGDNENHQGQLGIHRSHCQVFGIGVEW